MGASAEAETVSPAVTPPPGNPRFPLLDSLRAIAALAIVVYHVFFWGHAQQTHAYGAALTSLGLGVAIFFVLSGFLLYRPFINADLNGTPRPRLTTFLRRRILRIVPAYWVALTVLAIFPGLVGVFTDHWWRYYGFLQIYASQGLVRITGISVAWTLCVEVSFYVALPFYAAAVRWLVRGRSAVHAVAAQIGILFVLALSSLLFGYGLHGADTPPLLLTYFDWFALGMGLAVISAAVQSGMRMPRIVGWAGEHPASCWAAALIVYAVLTALVADARLHYEFTRSQAFEEHALGGLLALLVVLPAVFADRGGGWPRRVLAWSSTRWLGTISYGIYLWHLPLLLWLYDHGVRSIPLLLITTLAWTLACASASYYLVERPILRFKDPRPRSRSQPLGLIRAPAPWKPPRPAPADPRSGGSPEA